MMTSSWVYLTVATLGCNNYWYVIYVLMHLPGNFQFSDDLYKIGSKINLCLSFGLIQQLYTICTSQFNLYTIKSFVHKSSMIKVFEFNSRCYVDLHIKDSGSVAIKNWPIN